MDKIILTAVIALLLSWKGKGKPKGSKGEPVASETIKKALSHVNTEFGTAIAKNVEKIYRLETAHFKSGQFFKTYTAGMERFGSAFPWGWKSLEQFVKEFPEYGSPKEYSDSIPMTESGTGKTKYYIKFPSVNAAMMFLAFVLKQRGNEPWKWHTTNPEKGAKYTAVLNKITSPITDTLPKNISK